MGNHPNKSVVNTTTDSEDIKNSSGFNFFFPICNISRWCNGKAPGTGIAVTGFDCKEISVYHMQCDIYKALYDYYARDKEDMSFKAADRLLVLKKIDTGWWYAKNLRTKTKGLIPSNFVTIDGKQLEYQDWWFTCTRRDAIKQLCLPGNKKGTFLIRESAAEPDKFALSVRDCDLIAESSNIKHYHIKRSNKGKFFISNNLYFDSLIDLVKHYQTNASGLCCKLTTPCPKEADTIPFKNLEVDRQCVQLDRLIGKGSFGEVWKGTYNGTTDVAIKQLIPEKSGKEKFLEEAKFLQKMKHKNMVQIMGVCSEDEPALIIMEFVEFGSLRSYLHNDRGKTIKFKTLLDIAAQIASGMTYIEQSNFIHRDLRSVNCLVGKNNAIKIADFGLAKIQEIYNANAETPFPVRWTPPEAIEFQRYSIKSDVWSYGVVLFELVTYGELPYEREGIVPMQILAFLNDGNRLSNPSVKFTNRHKKYYCPDKMYKKMLDCWNKNPDKRPTFVKLSEFFESYYEYCEEND